MIQVIKSILEESASWCMAVKRATCELYINNLLFKFSKYLITIIIQ